MEKKDILKLYNGSMGEIEQLRTYLEDNHISTMVRNEFNESLLAGFPSGTPGNSDIYVLEEDFEQAVKLMSEFFK